MWCRYGWVIGREFLGVGVVLGNEWFGYIFDINEKKIDWRSYSFFIMWVIVWFII